MSAREQFDDAQMERLQARIRDLEMRNARQPFMDGVLIDAETGKTKRSGLSFTAATARSIAHGLGRKAIGFLEVYGADLPSAAHVGLKPSAPTSGITSATHVTVTPASTGTCFLFVF